MKVLLTLLLLLGVSLALSQAVEDHPETEFDPEANHDLVKSSGSCLNDWIRFRGRYFCYIPKPMSWAKAEMNCLSMQANLASVHSLEEFNFIQNLIWTFTHESGETWIGGSDAQEKNIWLWSNGRAFQYTNWCQPDGIHNCLLMNYGGMDCFGDQQCDYHYPSVCTKTVPWFPEAQTDSGHQHLH